ncbi:acyl-CoA synthetase [Acidimicrobiia bacterium EGI L10123]|uniref:acyl-CoA synthetase n=1 Tax=Salinilacustrithrix flava TaxID=2957203 RepID=UPI003D7C231E|nr:acyl-CoA synthetase [Acidimicrobiia bacterium EGI L10123]
MTEVGFWKIAEAEPDKLAIVDPDGNEITFGGLLADANRLVHGLRSLGLEEGDGVAAVLPNGIEMFALYMAAMQAGWYLTPINWHLVGPEIAYIVEDCEAKVFIGHERFADECVRAADEVSLDADRIFAVGDVPGARPYAELTEGQPDTTPENRTAGAAMHYTSGTTGRPKGVRRALSGVAPETVAGSGGLLGMFGVKPNDDNVHICGSPLYHTAVLAFASSSLHLGHAVVLMDKWTPESMLELIDRYQVTYSHMVPTQFQRLLSLPEDVRSTYDVSSLRTMIHAAAPCPVETKRQMLDWWGPVIYEYYAATEGGGTLVTPEEWLRKPGTVGTAWPGAEIRIIDDAGNDLLAGEIGTVYMKLPAAAAFEYFKDKDKTEANRVAGFFTVGDVGYLDEDGYLFLRDRKSDMIISGGANIYPAEIEGELIQHPEIADVAVFGIPNADWGEEIKAVVQLVPGVEPSDGLTAEIMDFARERMGKFKLPRSIDYVEELPRDPNGKLYKRKLRDPYWEGQERAI